MLLRYRMSRIAILILASASLVSTSRAPTLERLAFDDMIDQSTMVVRATVISSSGILQNGAIYTQYELAVTDKFKGGTRALKLFVPGGVAGGLRQLVPGAPTLVPGSEYLIFVWIGKSGRPQVIGLSQGLFNLHKDAVTGQWLAERPGVQEMMIDPKTGRPVTDETVRMKLTDIKARVTERIGQTQ